MQIKDLEAVKAVYKYNSFSEAAIRMSFSVSAISKQIARVEKELGVAIFERKNKGFGKFVTPEGELIIPVIDEILQNYSKLEHIVTNINDTDEKHLSLGYVPIIGSIGENAIVSSFLTDNPDVSVDLTIENNLGLVNKLSQGQLDGIFILLMGATSSTIPVFEAIASDELITVQTMRNSNLYIGMSGNNPLASQEILQLSQLINETFIFSTLQGDDCYDNRIWELQNLAGVPQGSFKRMIMDFKNREIVLNMVECGNAVLPQIVNPVSYGKNIKYVRVEGWPDEAGGLFICRKDNNSKTLKKFLRYVKDYSRENGLLGN